MSDSGSGGAAFMSQRTGLDRAVFDTIIDALLDGDEDACVSAAMRLVESAPSRWSGPRAHWVRVRREARP